MNKNEEYSDLAKFAKTDNEIKIMKSLVETNNMSETAEALGEFSYNAVNHAVRRIRRRAASRGYSPEHDMNKVCPEGFGIKGTSSLYKNPDAGPDEPVMQWVKTSKTQMEMLEVMEQTIEAMCADLTPVDEIPTPQNEFSSDLLSVIPLGDPHIGMLAWGEECGDNHNLEIGIRDLLGAIDRVVRVTPPSDHCLIINTGDFFHADLMDNKTWRSGHILDVDGRWMKIHDAGVYAIRKCIETALDHHKFVHVINAIGNHDDHSSMMLSICLKNVYENNPRVTIDASPKNIYKYRFGNNLIGVHHGHEIKVPQLPLVMANEWPNDWGDTEFRTWYTGHVHHDSVKEMSGCVVETVRTLAARDAYAASKGYYAQRDLKSIVHHVKYGPQERHIIPLKKVRDHLGVS